MMEVKNISATKIRLKKIETLKPSLKVSIPIALYHQYCMEKHLILCVCAGSELISNSHPSKSNEINDKKEINPNCTDNAKHFRPVYILTEPVQEDTTANKTLECLCSNRNSITEVQKSDKDESTQTDLDQESIMNDNKDIKDFKESIIVKIEEMSDDEVKDKLCDQNNNAQFTDMEQLPTEMQVDMVEIADEVQTEQKKIWPSPRNFRQNAEGSWENFFKGTETGTNWTSVNNGMVDHEIMKRPRGRPPKPKIPPKPNNFNSRMPVPNSRKRGQNTYRPPRHQEPGPAENAQRSWSDWNYSWAHQTMNNSFNQFQQQSVYHQSLQANLQHMQNHATPMMQPRLPFTPLHTGLRPQRPTRQNHQAFQSNNYSFFYNQQPYVDQIRHHASAQQQQRPNPQYPAAPEFAMANQVNMYSGKTEMNQFQTQRGLNLYNHTEIEENVQRYNVQENVYRDVMYLPYNMCPNYYYPN